MDVVAPLPAVFRYLRAVRKNQIALFNQPLFDFLESLPV